MISSIRVLIIWKRGGVAVLRLPLMVLWLLVTPGSLRVKPVPYYSSDILILLLTTVVVIVLRLPSDEIVGIGSTTVTEYLPPPPMYTTKGPSRKDPSGLSAKDREVGIGSVVFSML